MTLQRVVIAALLFALIAISIFGSRSRYARYFLWFVIALLALISARAVINAIH